MRSTSALALAEANAEVNGAAKVQVRKSDLLSALDGDFDLVMSNPPYIHDTDQLAYRHGGGEHGAEKSIRMVRAALDRLNPGGQLECEGYEQVERIAAVWLHAVKRG